MSTEKNKAIMRRIVEEAFNKGNLAVVDECTAAGYVLHTTPETKGPEGFKQMVTMLRTAFPDMHQTIEDMVAEGDKVAHSVTWRGTFKGEYMGIAPTGKKFTVALAGFTRFAGGKQVEGWIYADALTFYQQLGIPIPAQ